MVQLVLVYSPPSRSPPRVLAGACGDSFEGARIGRRCIVGQGVVCPSSCLLAWLLRVKEHGNNAGQMQNCS
jgi:tetrahydrodipicolinate N-succinyltransferase